MFRSSLLFTSAALLMTCSVVVASPTPPALNEASMLACADSNHCDLYGLSLACPAVRKICFPLTTLLTSTLTLQPTGPELYQIVQL